MSIINACVPRRFRREVIDSVTNYNWFIGHATNILQLAELNPDMPGLSIGVDGSKETSYTGFLRKWNQVRQKWGKRSNDRIKEIQGLGVKRWGKLFKTFYVEQLQTHSNGTKFEGKLSDRELIDRYGLDEESIVVRRNIEKDFSDFLSSVEQALIDDAVYRFKDPVEFGIRDRKISEIRNDFKKLRGQPYFPLMRFGKYTMTTFDEKGKMVEHQQFEKERFAEKASKQAKANLPDGHVIRLGVLPDITAGMQGMPSTLQKRIIEELNLTTEQQDLMNQLMHKMAPGQSFRKQLIRRRGVMGFAQDGLRTYANYFFHGSNHLARSMYSERLKETIDYTETRVPHLNGVIDMRLVQGIKKYLTDHFQYIMNPKNELAGLRAFGFLWYLGFSPKSAFINLSQVPLVTYPHLATKYGDTETVAALAKAMQDSRTAITRNKGFTEDEIRIYERLMEDGLYDQSFASELASISNGSHLDQALIANPFWRKMQQTVGASAWMFTVAEKYNRRITGTAAYRLSRAKALAGRRRADVSPEEMQDIENQGYLDARDAIERTQFEYSSWNRPVFMRGKKSVIFLFMNFIQNMMFFLSRGGEGRVRFLAIMVVAAGLQGMPFMEDLLDVIDTLLSGDNEKYDSRKELRDVLSTLVEDPDILLLGGSNYGFGLKYLGDMVGLPIPEFDVQGSLSLGRIVPGLGALTSTLKGEQTNPERALMDFSEDALGAMAAIPINFLRAGMSNSPYVYKRLEMAYPSFLRNVTKAGRLAITGEEITSKGATIVEFSEHNSEHTAEILMQAAGFAPRRITKMQRVRAKMKETEIFYSMRRRDLLTDLDYALNTGDDDVVKDVLKDVTRYNRDVPFAELGISRKDISRSRKSRRRSRQRTTQGLPLQERYVRVSRDIALSFGEDFTKKREP